MCVERGGRGGIPARRGGITDPVSPISSSSTIIVRVFVVGHKHAVTKKDMLQFIAPLDFADFTTRCFVGFYVIRFTECFATGISGQTLNYSKFFNKNRPLPLGAVPSRPGMIVLYTLPCLASVPYLPASVCGWMCFLHFGKRIAESAFLHKYSGSIDLVMVTGGVLAYAASTITRCEFARPDPEANSTTSLLGLACFALGELGNFYHHYLLANTRRGGANNEYVLPTGGLFDLVACPHYTFELVAMFGIACYGRNALAYVDTAIMGLYFAFRSRKTTAFYKEKFGNTYPVQRKNFIPFLW